MVACWQPTLNNKTHTLFFFLNPPSSEDDTIGDLKKLVAAQTGTRPDKLRIQKWHNVFKVGEARRRGDVCVRESCTLLSHTPPSPHLPTARTTSRWPTTRSTTAWAWSCTTTREGGETV